METLLDTLPSGDDDDLLAISRSFERLGCQRQRLAVYLGLLLDPYFQVSASEAILSWCVHLTPSMRCH